MIFVISLVFKCLGILKAKRGRAKEQIMMGVVMFDIKKHEVVCASA